MAEWPSRSTLQLPETSHPGVDTVCGCNCHCPCLWFLSVVHVRSGFVIILSAAGWGMGVGMLSIALKGVGVQAMLDAGLDRTRYIESLCEVPLDAGVLWLLVPGVVIGIIIDYYHVGDGVDVTHWVRWFYQSSIGPVETGSGRVLSNPVQVMHGLGSDQFPSVLDLDCIHLDHIGPGHLGWINPNTMDSTYMPSPKIHSSMIGHLSFPSHHALLTPHHSPLTTHHSALTTHHSALTTLIYWVTK